MAAGLLASACLTALVIVASVHGSDALATTAIALAIITFVVQLIVYVAQAEQTRRENELTQRLHAELRASLADLSARAQGTETTVGTINDKLLDKALQGAGSSKLEDLPPGFTRDVAVNLAELMEKPESSPSDTEGEFQSEFPTKTWGPDEDARVERMLTSWPSDTNEVNEIRENLADLPVFALVVMSRFAKDELEFRDPNRSLAPSLPSVHVPTVERLYDRGLIEDYEKEAYSHKLAHLTEKGRRVARAFVAKGEPPEGIAEFVSNIRAWVEKHESEEDLPDESDEPDEPVDN